MLLFSFPILVTDGQRKCVKTENKNAKTLTAETPYVGLEIQELSW